MNKILLNSEDDISNLVIEEDTELVINFINTSKYLNIIVEDDVCLNIIELGLNTSDKIVVTLKDNSEFIFNRLVRDGNDFIEVNIDGYSSYSKIENSLISLVDSSTKFNIRHNNKNGKSYLINHGINKKNNNLIFDVNVYINHYAVGTITNQENKIINLDNGKSNIYPNLIVDIDDVMANHSAYIGDFSKEIIFYINSRGIPISLAKDILIKNFLLINTKYDNCELIDTILNN